MSILAKTSRSGDIPLQPSIPAFNPRTRPSCKSHQPSRSNARKIAFGEDLADANGCCSGHWDRWRAHKRDEYQTVFESQQLWATYTQGKDSVEAAFKQAITTRRVNKKILYTSCGHGSFSNWKWRVPISRCQWGSTNKYQRRSQAVPSGMKPSFFNGAHILWAQEYLQSNRANPKLNRSLSAIVPLTAWFKHSK